MQLGTFFFHFCKKKWTIFSWKKKKVEKKNCGHPTGFNFSHPLYRKQNFVYGQPNILNSVVLSSAFFYSSEARPDSDGEPKHPDGPSGGGISRAIHRSPPGARVRLRGHRHSHGDRPVRGPGRESAQREQQGKGRCDADFERPARQGAVPRRGTAHAG